MADYTSISVSLEVKEEIDRQRQTPIGEVSINEFLSALLTESAKKKR